MRHMPFLFILSYSPSRPIVHSRAPVTRTHLGLFVPFVAGVRGHDAQRWRRNPHLQFQERLVSEAADARRDAASPSTPQPPRAPRVDHGDGPVPRLSSRGRPICCCEQRPRARLYVAPRPHGAPGTMAAGVSRGTQSDAGSVRRCLSRGSRPRGRALGGVGPTGNTAPRARDGIPVAPVSSNRMPLVCAC